MKVFQHLIGVEMTTLKVSQITPKVRLIINCRQPYIAKHSDYLEKEKYVLEQLKHPGIPQLYGINSDKRLLLEFMPGMDLSKFLFNPVDVPMIFMQLCDIIKYAHSCGIYHQDLKLENIVYDPENNKLSVIDWEFARIEGTSEKFFCTPYYAAPEVLNYEHSGPTNDIWSMGVILYQLYTRRRPFEGRNIKSLAANVNKMNPCYECIPPKAVNLLKRIFVHYRSRIHAAEINL